MVKNSVIQISATIINANITDSIIGIGAEVKGKSVDLSISDYSQIVT